MKNKLERTGKNRHYYQMKAAVTVLLFLLAIAALTIIPVGISYKLAEAQANAGDETTSVSAAEISHVQHQSLGLDYRG